MTPEKTPEPVISRFYNQYLNDENSASFIMQVATRYTNATLERLTLSQSRTTRRAAVLALGFLGDYSSNAIFGRALHDEDRGVRVLADNGIREVWMRSGSIPQRQELSIIARLNDSHQHEEAIIRVEELIEEAPWIAESWNQRAIALFRMERYEESANDCHQTLELNAYHFGAAVGMAHCYLELCDAFAALDNFRRAVKLNPGLEGVRAQIDYLQRTLEES